MGIGCSLALSLDVLSLVRTGIFLNPKSKLCHVLAHRIELSLLIKAQPQPRLLPSPWPPLPPFHSLLQGHSELLVVPRPHSALTSPHLCSGILEGFLHHTFGLASSSCSQLRPLLRVQGLLGAPTDLGFCNPSVTMGWVTHVTFSVILEGRARHSKGPT